MSYEPVAIQHNYEMENEMSYLMEPKSSESVDYVFKDESDFDEEVLHDKSFVSNGSEPEADINASSLIDEIEFTDGYFKRDLLPMLSKGHEGELCQYLKDIGVLKSSMRCGTESCESLRMTWTPARVVDKYQWSCTKCRKRKSIREESFFKGMKFILPIVLRAMQGWCGNYDSEELAQNMGLKPYAFRQVYAACREVAARHIKNVLANEILGGFNTVVILEVWSSGLKGAAVPIAGLIELKDNKIKYFYQPLRYNQQCSYGNEEPDFKSPMNEVDKSKTNNQQNKSNIKKLLAKVQNENNNNTFSYDNNTNKKRKSSPSRDNNENGKVIKMDNNGNDANVMPSPTEVVVKTEDGNDAQNVKTEVVDIKVENDVKMEGDTNSLTYPQNDIKTAEPDLKPIVAPDTNIIPETDTKPVIESDVDIKPTIVSKVDIKPSKPRPSRSRLQKDITGDLQTLIKQKVSPGTFLVLGNGISPLVASNLMRSDLNMNAVKTLDSLRSVENKDNPLSEIIALLLQRPSEVISLAREIPRSQLQQFLLMHLWYDAYASPKNYTNNNTSGFDNNNLPGHKGNINDNTLEILLHQIASEDYSNDREFMNDSNKGSIEIILSE